MYVRCSLLHQQWWELQQQDAHGIRCAEWILWVDDFVDEDADDIVIKTVLIWSWWAPNQSLAFILLEGAGKDGDQDVLQDLWGEEMDTYATSLYISKPLWVIFSFQDAVIVSSIQVKWCHMVSQTWGEH